MEMKTLLVLAVVLVLAVAPALGQDTKLIKNVPDINQPPLGPGVPIMYPPPWVPPAMPPGTFHSWCTPTAAANVVWYWDKVMARWTNVMPPMTGNAWIDQKILAQHLGYFMDTNDLTAMFIGGGVVDGHPGTFIVGTTMVSPPFRRYNPFDGLMGIQKYLFWNMPPIGTNIGLDYFNPLPSFGKSQFEPERTSFDETIGFGYLRTRLLSGRPVLASFVYWNPIVPAAWNNYQDRWGKYYDWGQPMTTYFYPGDPDNPEPFEENMSVCGHTVTVVGYMRQYDPDGAGPLPKANWMICHDTWPGTGDATGNVVIPFRKDLWMGSMLNAP
jgi:hypothetical protein